MENLKTILAIVKYALGVEAYDVKGIKDTPAKIMACYLAEKHSGMSHKCIADYFQINPDFMVLKIEDLSVELLMDAAAKDEFLKLEKLYHELQETKIDA